MSITSSRSFRYSLGTSTPAEDTTIVLGTGSAGDPDAKRRLVHPLSASWNPITYNTNPQRTSNLDNELIPVPIMDIVMTQESTKVQRFARATEDVVVKEQWPGSSRAASMETQFLRALLQYLLNPPALDPVTQTYIQWEPRDRNTYTYNVEIGGLTVGGTPAEIWVTDFIPNQGDIGGGMQNSDVPGSGVVLEPVELTLKIVSQVT